MENAPQTNRSYAKEAQTHQDLHPLSVACKVAKIPVTKRQASKWRMGKGLAFSKKGYRIAESLVWAE